MADPIQSGPPTKKAAPEHAENSSVAVEVEVSLSGDFSQRVRLEGTPEQVLKVAPAAFRLVMETMEEAERRQIRKRFMVAAHLVVFGGAALSLVGLILDFANVRDFNTRALFTMGVWLLGSVGYLYFAVIKDAFGLKVKIPKPPTFPSGRPD